MAVPPSLCWPAPWRSPDASCARPVRPVKVMHGCLDDAATGVLDLLHQLQADHPATLLQTHPVEDRAAHESKIAVDIPDAEPEERPHGVVIEASDDDPV